MILVPDGLEHRRSNVEAEVWDSKAEHHWGYGRCRHAVRRLDLTVRRGRA